MAAAMHRHHAYHISRRHRRDGEIRNTWRGQSIGCAGGCTRGVTILFLVLQFDKALRFM